jgi:hypothetical protein
METIKNPSEVQLVPIATSCSCKDIFFALLVLIDQTTKWPTTNWKAVVR